MLSGGACIEVETARRPLVERHFDAPTMARMAASVPRPAVVATMSRSSSGPRSRGSTTGRCCRRRARWTDDERPAEQDRCCHDGMDDDEENATEDAGPQSRIVGLVDGVSPPQDSGSRMARPRARSTVGCSTAC